MRESLDKLEESVIESFTRPISSYHCALWDTQSYQKFKSLCSDWICSIFSHLNSLPNYLLIYIWPWKLFNLIILLKKCLTQSYICVTSKIDGFSKKKNKQTTAYLFSLPSHKSSAQRLQLLTGFGSSWGYCHICFKKYDYCTSFLGLL